MRGDKADQAEKYSKDKDIQKGKIQFPQYCGWQLDLSNLTRVKWRGVVLCPSPKNPKLMQASQSTNIHVIT